MLFKLLKLLRERCHRQKKSRAVAGFTNDVIEAFHQNVKTKDQNLSKLNKDIIFAVGDMNVRK
jgi:hypothetical protein